MPEKFAVNQRVRDLMDALGFPKNVDAFYKKYFGPGRSEKLRTIYNDENLIKTDFLVELTEKVGQLEKRKPNGHWLLTGEGEMFLNEKAAQNEAAELQELFKDLAHLREVNGKNVEIILNLSRAVSVANQG